MTERFPDRQESTCFVIRHKSHQFTRPICKTDLTIPLHGTVSTQRQTLAQVGSWRDWFSSGSYGLPGWGLGHACYPAQHKHLLPIHPLKHPRDYGQGSKQWFILMSGF